MQSLSRLSPFVDTLRHIAHGVESSLNTLQTNISESTADMARQRIADYVALKSASSPVVFDLGERVHHIEHGVLMHLDGRVVEHSRHGVLVEFPHGGQMLLPPEALCRLG